MTGLIFALVLLACRPTASRAQATEALRIDVHFTMVANLLYQLDCVSGSVQACGLADYQALWRERFLRARQDTIELAAWGALRRRYDVSASLEQGGDTVRLGLADKVRLASLQSADVDSYLVRLETLLSPADWLIARRVVRHFQAPFTAWWDAEAVAAGMPFRNGLERLLDRADIRDQISRFARFYGTTFPPEVGVPINLFLRPERVVGNTSGQQIERYAVLEFLRDEDPAHRLDVAVHELCHFFFETRSPASTAALTARFRASPRVGAVAGFNLLNEALATALGNGVLARMVSDSARWARLMATPMALYANPYIDQAARALLPIVDRGLREGGTLDDPSFVAEYLAAIDASFGPRVTAPALLLNELYLYIDATFTSAVRATVRQAVRPGSMYAAAGSPATTSFDDFTSMPALNALFVLSPRSVAVLLRRGVLPAAFGTQLRAAAARPEATTLALRRPSGAYWFFVLARSDAEANAAVTRLAAQDRAEPARVQGR